MAETVNREELNERAVREYGIVNAADMDDKQLEQEIAAIDQTKTDAEKENQKALKEETQQKKVANSKEPSKAKSASTAKKDATSAGKSQSAKSTPNKSDAQA